MHFAGNLRESAAPPQIAGDPGACAENYLRSGVLLEWCEAMPDDVLRARFAFDHA